MDLKKVQVKNFEIGPGNPLCVIAGPCQIESLEHSLSIAEHLKNVCAKFGVSFVYKSSFDKANRTSIGTKRGVGIDAGLKILNRVKRDLDVAILTDIHAPEHAATVVGAGVDILQIPAFLSRQTDLLLAAGETGAAVNIKKGQFMAPGDMARAAEKIASTGNDKILLCERGVTHGYNNLVVDMRSLPIMQRTGYPVVFDCTHSVQQPGGMGTSSGGDRAMVPFLTRAAVATGCLSAVFIETHQDPESAPSDGPNMVPLKDFEILLYHILMVHKTVASLPALTL
jgi:2-dehydro-3-deoxyphosphooctonate aldolase (KDO 8-P synthase)